MNKWQNSTPAVFVKIIEYWFGPLYSPQPSVPELLGFWFGSRADLDREMTELFAHDLLAVAGQAPGDTIGAGEALGAVLLLDQMPRNIYRGTPEAFAFDAQSYAIMRRGLDRGLDHELRLFERIFFYFPLMHAETLADQEEMVRRVEALEPRDGLEQTLWQLFVEGARDHRAIIAEFGRFPHRNAVLGRESTAAEQRHLDRIRADKARPDDDQGGKPFELSQAPKS